MIDADELDDEKAFGLVSRLFSSHFTKPTVALCLAMLEFGSRNLFRIVEDDDHELLNDMKKLMENQWNHANGMSCGNPECQVDRQPMESTLVH